MGLPCSLFGLLRFPSILIALLCLSGILVKEREVAARFMQNRDRSGG